MSTFIRRYSRYLNEKAMSYRLVAVDFTKMKRGIDGVMRTMNIEKLIKTLPIIQNQLDALLDFQANPNELTNGVINSAFMLLFKDSIRLFAAYNEGVINLLASLEGKKTKELTADTRASTLSSAVSSLSSTGMSFSRMDEKERQQALEEEQARLQALKDQRLKEIGMSTPPSASPSSQSMGSVNNNHHNTNQGMELFSAPSTNSMPNLSRFDALGDLLKPTVPSHNQAPPMALHHPGHPHPGHPHPGHPGGKLLANDLDSSLANLVGNLQFGGAPAKKPDMQWSQPGEKKLTGGHNWQSKTMTTTTAWNPAPMAPAPMPVQHMAPAPMTFPMTTPQVPMYGMLMAPQPMMYNQPVLRPTNPFAPMPGAQVTSHHFYSPTTLHHNTTPLYTPQTSVTIPKAQGTLPPTL
ncbi:unnamed protein product, partial [Coregonus sp. 'balchen']